MVVEWYEAGEEVEEVTRAIDKPLGGSRGWSDKVVTGREGRCGLVGQVRKLMVGGKAREIQGTFKSIGNVSLQEQSSKPGAIEHPSWKAEDTRWEKHGTKQTRMMEDGGREFMGKEEPQLSVDRRTLSAADPGVGLVTGPYGAYHYGGHTDNQ